MEQSLLAHGMGERESHNEKKQNYGAQHHILYPKYHSCGYSEQTTHLHNLQLQVLETVDQCVVDAGISCDSCYKLVDLQYHLNCGQLIVFRSGERESHNEKKQNDGAQHHILYPKYHSCGYSEQTTHLHNLQLQVRPSQLCGVSGQLGVLLERIKIGVLKDGLSVFHCPTNYMLDIWVMMEFE
ncbi:hypothetical protein RHSIM_Rhsim04G0043600 [Rhododendron simsii]|uniref:Uncharacterized protein n=1 Tax=Rhododendron simsii TaxID=118357 RepID=A0A834GYY7_RHOSS|nr:hypothetical protein RHSIM_Rhsim04G0043600 [Rhododendron simsii]